MTGAQIGIRCDAGPRTGVGHLMRCAALAEELSARGARVHVLADLGGLAWAEEQLSSRGLAWHPAPAGPAGLAAAARRLRLDAMVLDSYTLHPGSGRALRDDGRLVVAVVDGDLRGAHADVYVDQNLDAELLDPPLPPGAVRLAGLRYVLLRRAVRRWRPDRPRTGTGRTAVPRVVCFFGGTDPYRAAPVATRILVDTGVPFDALVVGATADIRADLRRLPTAPGQRLTVLEATGDLARHLDAADLVVGASGTTAWEVLCLGLPAALLWVADNQESGYRRLVHHGLVAGLGHLAELTAAPAAARAGAVLRDLLTDPVRRHDLGRRAWAACDGDGASRVAHDLLNRIAG